MYAKMNINPMDRLYQEMGSYFQVNDDFVMDA
jgi:hypothetical protein